VHDTTSSLHLSSAPAALSSIPDRRLTFGQLHLLVLTLLARDWLEPSRQAKVADLELAIGVDEEVAGFEISVYDIG
jgi:hypothetical protein